MKLFAISYERKLHIKIGNKNENRPTSWIKANQFQNSFGDIKEDFLWDKKLYNF